MVRGGRMCRRQSPGKPVTYKGLEMSVAGVERAPKASLKDCPPGGNTVNATTRPGEEFAVVQRELQSPARLSAEHDAETAGGHR